MESMECIEQARTWRPGEFDLPGEFRTS